MEKNNLHGYGLLRFVMKDGLLQQIFFLLLISLLGACATANQAAVGDGNSDEWADDAFFEEDAGVYDPWEGLNRKFFVFNDTMYFWVVKPVAEVYSYAVPADIRVAIKRAVVNVSFPIRAVNNLLQGRFQEAGIETVRFVVNSTLGFGGLTDPAEDLLALSPREEDFGQTLGAYGINGGPYLCLPIIGPSNVRDAVGEMSDYLFDPFFYLTWGNLKASTGLYAYDKINRVSLVLGEYEKFKDESFDPYVAMRDAYLQNRLKKIQNSDLMEK